MCRYHSSALPDCVNQGQKRYPKGLLRQSFCRTSGESLGLKALVLLGSALELFRKFLVLFVRFFGFGVPFSALSEFLSRVNFPEIWANSEKFRLTIHPEIFTN